MNRKLTLAMLLSLSAASPLSLALGLGEADVRSTLNAPLRASLPLTDAAGIEPGLLNVSVADERAFEEAGLERTPQAASVQLSVAPRSDRLVVELTTERPVREPWLDLLLRFDWPGGQQLHEVTLLLDPPDYDQMPALVAGSRGLARPVPAIEPAPSASPRATESSSPAAPARSGDRTRVRSGDTLWSVAGRLRPDSDVTMNQMMVALVEANPEAFPTGNINAMRAGPSLIVPSREAVASRSPDDADRIVAAMNQAWASRGTGEPAPVALMDTATPPGEESGSPPDASEPEPVAETDPDEPVASPEAPRLALLTDAQLAAEGATPGEPENGSEEADEATGSPRVMVDPDVLASLSGAGELTRDERLARLEGQWLEGRDALEAVQEERDQLQEELSEVRAELASLREQVAALTAADDGVGRSATEGPGVGAPGVDAPGVGGTDGVTPPGDQAEERPWWGALYPGGVGRHLMLGGAGLAVLLALWLVVRHRRREEEDEPTAFGPGPVRVSVGGSQAPGRPGTASPTAAAQAAPSVQGSLPQAEAVSEADIFIAYGRFDQARELLEANLAQEPARDDLRLKLLNVHLELGNREEAESEAARLRESSNPAVSEEVERLLLRYGAAASAPSADGASPHPGEPAVFDKPAELSPRVFDEAADDQAAGDEAAGDGERAKAADRADTVSADAGPAEDAPGRPEPVADPAPNGGEDTADEPAPVEPASVTTRRLEDGSDIIDYRPPALDPSPAPREETPMQPSIDFTSEEGGASAQGGDLDGEAVDDTPAQEWEVEEVSFPPLEADNDGFASSAAEERLAEARRLVDAGDADRARGQLDALVESDDPATRDEALALLERLDT